MDKISAAQNHAQNDTLAHRPPATGLPQPVSLAMMSTWQSGILQSRVHRTIKKLSDSFLSKYGLTTMHWFIVGAVYETGDTGIRLTELANKVGTTQSYLTNALNILEGRRLISRSDNPADNRTKILTVPIEFRATCKEIENGLRDTFRHSFYQRLTRPELEAYIKALQKLASVV